MQIVRRGSQRYSGDWIVADKKVADRVEWSPYETSVVVTISEIPDPYKDNAKYDYEVFLSIDDIRRIVRVLEDQAVLKPVASLDISLPKQAALYCDSCNKHHQGAVWFRHIAAKIT